MKKLLLALAMMMTVTGMASAATLVLTNGGSYVIDAGNDFIGNVTAAGGAGSAKFTFSSTSDPVDADAVAAITVKNLKGFTNLLMSWVSVPSNTVLTSTGLVAGLTTLSTVFSAPNLTQALTFTWTASKSGANLNLEVAAVPLPAAGFLLLGALGGLAALRRRKVA